ncbi:MAG TPA: DUF3806 domain-containing protein [Burkholderiaceae bacterium]
MKLPFISILIFWTGVAAAADPHTQEIKLPDGEIIKNTVTTVDPSPQKIRILNQRELSNIEAQSQMALDFVKYYFPKIQTPNLKDYDHAFRAWQVSQERKFSEAEVTQMLGSYLGNKCAADLNMEWVEVTDKYGTEFAVRSKKVEVMSFPYAVVQKRIDNHQYDFISNVFHTVETMQRDGQYKSR